MHAAPVSMKAFAARPGVARAPRAQRLRTQAVAIDTAKLSAEQLAFLERKRRETSGSPAPAASRGRSAAPAASKGLSAEQQAFLDRKARETSRSPSPAPTRGRSNTPRASFRASSAPRSAPASSPTSYNPPSSASSAGGLSAEQQAFLDRKARETSRSPAPAPTRGRSNTPRASFRASSAPRPAPASSPTSYNPPSSASSAGGLSAEQQAFLDRKARETSRSPSPAPTRGRSNTPRASFRASSAPRPAPVSSPTSYNPPSSASSAGGLSAEQQAFLDRKARETSRSPSPAPTRGRSNTPRASFRSRAVSNVSSASAMGSSASSYGAAASSYRYVSSEEQARLSKEQCDFLERKRSGSK